MATCSKLTLQATPRGRTSVQALYGSTRPADAPKGRTRARVTPGTTTIIVTPGVTSSRALQGSTSIVKIPGVTRVDYLQGYTDVQAPGGYVSMAVLQGKTSLNEPLGGYSRVVCDFAKGFSSGYRISSLVDYRVTTPTIYRSTE